jgi:hypothetical protein
MRFVNSILERSERLAVSPVPAEEESGLDGRGHPARIVRTAFARQVRSLLKS